MSGDNAFLCSRCLYDPDAWRAKMSERGEKTYRPWEPERYRQDAHSPAAKLPEGDLVFFLLDTVPQLGLGRFYEPYEHDTRGAPPYDPAMMSACCCMPTVWGCFRAARSPWPANGTWPFSPSWARTVRTSAPPAIFASCIWRRSRTCLCRWCVRRQRRAWCSWAT